MEYLFSSVEAVGKLVFIAGISIYISRGFANKSKLLKAFSYISVKIFLPCLLLSELARNISWEMLRKYYWACILPFVPMVIGFSSSLLLRSCFSSELHGLLHISCTFQNVVSYGLGLAMNLNTPWYNESAKKDAQSYVFLYNVIHSLFLWSVGMMIIEKCVVALEKSGASTSSDDAGLTTDTATSSTSCSITAGIMGLKAGDSEIGGVTVISPSGNGVNSGLSYQPVTRLEDYRPLSVSRLKTGKLKRKRTEDTTWMEYIGMQLSYLLTEQLIASFIGLLIALVPPCGMLVDNLAGNAILGGISILASGTVPLQLIVLGINFTVEGDTTVVLPFRFLLGVILLRLVFIPLMCFLLVHILIISALIPFEKPFVLIMLLLSSAPTAINTSIICSLYEYKVKEYVRLLFFMYLSCIFTTTAWLSVFMWYLES